MSFAAAMFIALLLDVAVGWPDWLFRRIGHPVSWLGRAIAAMDERINRDDMRDQARRLAGVWVVACIMAAVVILGLVIDWMLPEGWIGVVLTGILAWPLVAARSLHDHVEAVAAP